MTLTTTRRGIVYPDPTSPRPDRADIALHISNVATALDVDVLYNQGTDAARIAAAHQPDGGLVWWTTDLLQLWYDDGAAWQLVTAPLTPPGSISMFGGAAAPAGWTLCDGASYGRADGTHNALFAAIGTAYGAADGTHFNVPDMRGRMPAGYAAAGGHADVSTLGLNDGVAEANRRPKHNHTVTGTPSIGTLVVTGSPTLGSLTVSGAPAIGSLSVSGAPAVGTLALPNHGHNDTLSFDIVFQTKGTIQDNAGSPYNMFPFSGGNSGSVIAEKSGSVGNPTSNPGISGAPAIGSLAVAGAPAVGSLAVSGAPALGSLAVGGAPTAGSLAVGPGGTTAVDTPAYLVVNFIIKL